MAEPTKTMLHMSKGTLTVFVNDEQVPTDVEWDAYLDAVRAAGKLGPARILIVTRGGAPTAKQRKASAALAKASPIRAALLSDNVLARAVVTALNWLGVDIKPFTWKETARALSYLDVSEADARWAIDAAREMQKKLGTALL